MATPHSPSWQKKNWSDQDYQELIAYLSSISEGKYREFNQKLIPGTTKIYGVRIPLLRQIAKEISRGNWQDFLKIKKNDWHEELIIEAIVIANAKQDFDELQKSIDYFVPKINNWAVNDTFSDRKLIAGYEAEFWPEMDRFLASQNPWSQRFGVTLLMTSYLSDEYFNEALEKVAALETDHYYVQMAIAWFLATAYTKQPAKVQLFFSKKIIDPVIMKMTKQKIRDSRQVSVENKNWLKSI